MGAGPSSAARIRHAQAGVTLVEILVVLVLIGVSASVIGLSVNGGSRSGTALERTATLLAVRLEQATATAVLRGVPAGFVWDAQGYAFKSFEVDGWSAHPTPTLAGPFDLDQQMELTVAGLARGQYLIRPDAVPSGGGLAVDIVSGQDRWQVVSDGIVAIAQPAAGLRP